MDWIGEVLGIEGGPRLVIGWTLAVLFVAWALARLPGIAVIGLRNIRVLQLEWAAAKKSLLPLKAAPSPTDTEIATEERALDRCEP